MENQVGGDGFSCEPMATDCAVCGEGLSGKELETHLKFEPQYWARIEALDRNNVDDIQLVYCASLEFFHSAHWMMFHLVRGSGCW